MRYFAFVMCLGSLALITGCGYALAGRGSFLPDYIKIVGVPQFENRTTTFNLDQIVTTQVRSELSGRGGQYRVVPENTGDAVITGVVTGLSIAPVVTNANQLATRYAVTLIADVKFTDLHTNKVIWSNPSMQFRDEYPVSSGTNGVTDANQFFRQDANALVRLAQNFAKSVITSILENF